MIAAARYRGDLRVVAIEEQEQVAQLLGKVIRGKGRHVPSERGRGNRVRPGCTSESEVDATGMEGLEHAELLGHDERGVIGQHHPAGTDPDRRRRRREMRDEHGRGGARDTGHVVVLGNPQASVAQTLAETRQRHRVGQRGGRCRPLADGSQLQNRERRVGRRARFDHSCSEPLERAACSRASGFDLAFSRVWDRRNRAISAVKLLP